MQKQGRAGAGAGVGADVCVRLCAPLLLCALVGCSAALHPLRTARLSPRDLTLRITVDNDANKNSVVPVDLVAVEHKKMVPEIAALTAAQWFAKKDDYMRMRSKDLRIASWEFVPGSIVPDEHVSATLDKAGVFLFAKYTGKGAFRATLPDSGLVQVHLLADDFNVAEPKVPGVAIPPAKQ